ncbi:uncharacterized protein BKA55DRAFT_689868 [Fusarium redolens]|uniref:Uncharacterized protein n=1 Tax=Fusarium redolens TaxID=48865 RepID=A0A9P9HC36_FUSRE|nr:uncharacterized protein BKA55DRAFT_689868 [Fusarium redolens]KAH7254372.1 hypothetical protein BKA55DRAFT_689868 [Fusarium redolens]
MAATTPAATPTNAMLEETRLSSDEKTEVGSNIIEPSADSRVERRDRSIQGIGPNANNEEPQYPGAAKLTLIISSLCLAIFLIALNQTIIAPALALQPIYRTIYKYFNIKFAYLAAVLIFEIYSLVLTIMPSSVVFIIGRAVAGNGLINKIKADNVSINPNLLINIRSSEIKEALAKLGHLDAFDAVLEAYIKGLRDTYYISLAYAAYTFIACLFFQWKLVKKGPDGQERKPEPAVPV